LNYFFTRKFSATTGFEYWSEDDDFSVVIGARYFIMPQTFLRARGFIGANELAIGAGWAKPLSENLHFETMLDLYFDNSLALRVGLVYIIRREPDE
jgi:hypothetical protein